MKLLQYSILTEDDGWYHTGRIEFHPGIVITIEDDTDTVVITAPQGCGKKALAEAWDYFKFGTSLFPVHRGDAEKVRKPLGHLTDEIVLETTGVELSHLVAGTVPPPPKISLEFTKEELEILSNRYERGLGGGFASGTSAEIRDRLRAALQG